MGYPHSEDSKEGDLNGEFYPHFKDKVAERTGKQACSRLIFEGERGGINILLANFLWGGVVLLLTSFFGLRGTRYQKNLREALVDVESGADGPKCCAINTGGKKPTVFQVNILNLPASWGGEKWGNIC